MLHIQLAHYFAVDTYVACFAAGALFFGQRAWQRQKAPSGDVFIVKNGDRFFLVTEKGDLIIARLSAKGYDEISRAHLLEPTSTAFGREIVWSHPAFADRCLFARNDREIICVSLAGEKK